MKIVLVGILKIIFLSFVSSDSGVPCHHCVFEGAAYRDSFKLSKATLPERCEAVTYGFYLFDSDEVDDGNMYKEDEDVIQSMLAANVPVYTQVAFMHEDRWSDFFFCPSSPDVYDTNMNPLLKKINDLKLSGIILCITDIYNGTDNANKIVSLVNKIKTEVPTLKIGLSLMGQFTYFNFPDNSLFDFTITNNVIDFYDIELYTPYTLHCTPELAATGTLITSSNSSILTLEVLGNAVSQSTMDKSKTYGRLHEYPHVGGKGSTYSGYCAAEGAEACEACADNTTTFHEMGAFVKKYFHGVAVAWPQYDDIDSLCGCQPFPATNAIFDGFDGKAVTPCAKMDKK